MDKPKKSRAKAKSTRSKRGAEQPTNDPAGNFMQQWKQDYQLKSDPDNEDYTKQRKELARRPTAEEDAQRRRAHLCDLAALKASRKRLKATTSPLPYVRACQVLEGIEREFQRPAVKLEELESHIATLCALQITFEDREAQASKPGHIDLGAVDQAQKHILTIRNLKDAFVSGSVCAPLSRPDADPDKFKMKRQVEAIEQALRGAGYDPMKLPTHQPGKSGVKSEMKKKLVDYRLFTSDSFDHAWKRFRLKTRQQKNQ